MMLILSEASNFKEPALMEAVSFDAEMDSLTLGVARVIVIVSPEVASRRKRPCKQLWNV